MKLLAFTAGLVSVALVCAMAVVLSGLLPVWAVMAIAVLTMMCCAWDLRRSIRRGRP